MTLEQKVGSLFVIGFNGTTLTDQEKAHIKDCNFSSFIYFKQNVANKAQLIDLSRSLREIAGEEAFITIDQEGGMVTRILNGATFFPGARVIAQSSAKKNRLVGEYMGQELLSLGINFNLAPDADVNSNPDNPVIGVRSYSNSPEIVSSYVCEYVAGIQSKGVIATVKHFPGHGDTRTDSHYGLPVIEHSMERIQSFELYPFKQAIDKGVKAVMTSHILFKVLDDVPATISKAILTGLLREKLDFKGIIITDCMEMKAIADTVGTPQGAVMAIKAGADLVCVSHTLKTQREAYEAVLAAVKSGEISEERIDESIKRINEAKREFIVKGYDTVSQAEYKAAAELADELSYTGIVQLKGDLRFNDGKTLLVKTSPISLNDADGELDEGAVNFPSLKCDILSPKTTAPDEIIKAAADYDNVIVFTYNASMFPEQVKLVKGLLEVKPDLKVVATRNPSDINYFDEILHYVTTFEYSALSMRNLVRFVESRLEIV